MTKLPVPYGFGVSDTGLRDDLEAVLQDNRRIEREANKSYAFEREALRHFIRRVERAPKAKLNKYALIVADRLARHARLSLDGTFEVRQAITNLAYDAKIAPETFKDGLAALARHGLIDILRPGSGNGHPTHIRLCINAEHHEQITRQAAKSLRDHLELQTRRFTLLEPRDS
jgi:hypothetical protein